MPIQHHIFKMGGNKLVVNKKIVPKQEEVLAKSFIEKGLATN